MKKNILTILSVGALLLFSCGEESNPAETETMVNEIENATAVTDSLNNEIEAIEAETNELDELVEDL